MKEEQVQWQKDGWKHNPQLLIHVQSLVNNRDDFRIDLETIDDILEVIEYESLKSQLKQREEQLTDINATWNEDLNEIKELKEALSWILGNLEYSLSTEFAEKANKAKKLL